ncbi:GATOR1 complex protein NPRL3-like [Ptychodera flava]|uniref:GATOR1 complex protein NPRL3-like n=1 Tax=Ptychodera flava TaxID=63121 RepID=UPI003969EEA6
MFKCNPIAVILVSSGSRGDRLLFRYPYEFDGSKEVTEPEFPRNPYAVREDKDQTNGIGAASDSLGQLAGYSDEILTTVLATKTEVCGHKFVLKVDNIRFVGHPTLVQDVNNKFQQRTRSKEAQTMILFNVVFVLQGDVFQSVVHCYHDLSKRLALALRHEERRCGYLSNQARIMLAVHDEVAAMPEDIAESPFRTMLPKSKLCRDLKEVYENLCNAGVVSVQINNWVQVSFCLPHKVHNVEQMHIQADVIEKSLKAIRPYHAVLLLEDETELLDSLPADSSPSLIRIIKMTNPLKSLQQLSQDCDLALSQVFQVAGHLVYWGKATIIYPLCETNVYVLSPNCDLRVASDLAESFTSKFPGQSLTAVISNFSLPLPFGEHRNPLGWEQQKIDQVRIVVWLLQNRLLVQLHTYVFLMPIEKYSQMDTDTIEGSVSRHRMISERSTGSSGSGLTEPHFDTDDLIVSPGLDSYSSKSMELGSNEQSLPDEMTMKRGIRDTNLLSELSYAERLSVLSVPASSNDDDLKLFDRLCPYFRGKHHLEEIMYYENLSRSQLITLLDKFRDVLITCSHQDAATITYQEFL